MPLRNYSLTHSPLWTKILFSVLEHTQVSICIYLCCYATITFNTNQKSNVQQLNHLLLIWAGASAFTGVLSAAVYACKGYLLVSQLPVLVVVWLHLSLLLQQCDYPATIAAHCCVSDVLDLNFQIFVCCMPAILALISSVATTLLVMPCPT